ncbi:MAG: hypothetical protein KGY99_01385 [Phycisphaerae bacterium]|nr:hypothetical protein [Phycisphaerae bacterium]
MIRQRTINLAAVAMAVVTVCAVAPADTVDDNGTVWHNVRVSDCADGALSFEWRTQSLSRPLERIRRITLYDQPAFNKAESQLQEAPARAVALYDRAEKNARRDWLKRLIAYRRLTALGKAGRIGQWVRHWGQLLKEGDEPLVAAEFRPASLGTPEQNGQALQHLQSLLEGVDDERVAPAIRAVMATLRRAGADDAAEGSEAAPSERPAADTRDMDVSVRAAAEQRSRRLRDMESLLASGDARAAVRAIDAQLPELTDDELPRALYLAGMARMKASPEASNAAELLAEAGVMFMKVAVFYPFADDAPEALLRAGTVSERLGNDGGAASAYEVVVARYADSASAKAARRRLAALARSGAESSETPDAVSGEGNTD